MIPYANTGHAWPAVNEQVGLRGGDHQREPVAQKEIHFQASLRAIREALRLVRTAGQFRLVRS